MRARWQAPRSKPWAVERELDCFVACAPCNDGGRNRAFRALRANRLDIVAVGIDQERGVIGRAVIGARAGAAIVAAAGLDALGMELPDRVMILRAKGDVSAGGRRALMRVKPQRGLALGPKARAVLVFRAQDIAERRQCRGIEAHAGVEIADF